jgi:hypothetical protein
MCVWACARTCVYVHTYVCMYISNYECIFLFGKQTTSSITYANDTLLYKTVETLWKLASAPNFLWPANFRFSSFNQYTSLQSQTGRFVIIQTQFLLCFCQIEANFMLQYDPCKDDCKLIKNSFSLLNISVYHCDHQLQHWILRLASWIQSKSSHPISLKQL